MQPLGIYGTGLAGGLGVGLESAVRALGSGVPALSERQGVRGAFAPELPAPSIPGGRRFSPWLKMSLTAAREALAGIASPAPERLGVIGATGYGSLAHTVSFLENMIARGEAEPQPANFIYSVHSAAATQVALGIQARGYNLTVTHGATCFEQALQAASRRLSAGLEDHWVVLGADEWHPRLQAALRRFGVWRRSSAGAARFPGEGAAAWVVGPAREGLPAVADVRVEKISPALTAPAERERLTEALQNLHRSWDDVAGVLAGLGQKDSLTPDVFRDWEKLTGRPVWPYLNHTGYFSAASATAVTAALAAVKTGARWPGAAQNQEKNPHGKVIILYNRSQVGIRSWVMLTL